MADERSKKDDPDPTANEDEERQQDDADERESKAVDRLADVDPSLVPANEAAPSRGSRRSFLFGLGVGLALGGVGGYAGHYWYLRLRRRRRRPRRPKPPAFVPLATHNPRQGPDPAKVTIVEFCEFQ